MEKKVIFISAALLLLLSFTPLLHADVLLRYDDDDMDASGARVGQAVRFTVPSEGNSCKLESLSVYVEQYDGNQMMMSIWADDGGKLIEAVGSLLFEKEKIVTDYSMYKVDLSDENITIPPGGSFFGGWTSSDNLMAYWDTSEPNDVTLQKFVGSPWLISPPGIDAPIFAEISFVLPELNEVSPVSCARGAQVSLVIDANDAEFWQDGLSTIEDVWLSQGDVNIVKIMSTGFIPTDSNSLRASFDLPTDAALGSWDLYVESSLFNETLSLTDAFRIFASPDLNRDGKIDIIDFNFSTIYWLQDIDEQQENAAIAVGSYAAGAESAAAIPTEMTLLQYDDSELNGVDTETQLEGIGTIAGQAVRFTVPPDQSCKLESLSIFIAEFDRNDTMKASIWIDDGNDLAASVGISLFEEEKIVGEPMWHTIDLSDENIIIPPGGSFFGGWTSDDYLMGMWDTSDPNGRTLQKYLGTDWLESPPDIDAPIKVEISYERPVIGKISPAACARGTTLEMVVDANDANFSQDGNSTINAVWLSKDGANDISSTLFIPLTDYPDSLVASFDIPADVALGQWDVNVDSAKFGLLKPFTAGLTIFASPDLNRDGNVNIIDFNFFSQHWQKNIVRIPVDVLIPAGEFALGGDPNGPMTTIDEFYMSNFEISNQQYCYFLNSAISKGEIKVVSNKVYSWQDEENANAYFTCNPSLPDSQIQYSNGFFEVASDKSRNMTADPVVAVSWYGAAGYCNWRSVKENKDVCYDTSTWVCDFTKNGYRLPTEAEWEYAARAGKYDPYLRFGWGDTISHDQANYFSKSQYHYDISATREYHPDYEDSESTPYTAPAGSFAANDYGLHDMAGNVWEWCNDWYASSYSEVYDNPTGPISGKYVIIRGGSWKNPAILCRTINRNSDYPTTIGAYTGFRVCTRP